MIEILKKAWSYTLYKNEEGNYILSVVCGSVGLFEVEHTLNPTEKEKFEKEGQIFIDELVYLIRFDPSKFVL